MASHVSTHEPRRSVTPGSPRSAKRIKLDARDVITSSVPSSEASSIKTRSTSASSVPSDSARVNYRNGLHLAPMVRCGTLPTRLLALHYGANLVWGPEIIDRAMMGSTRTEVPLPESARAHGGKLIKFMKNGRSVFETHSIEKSRLIYQIGSSNAQQAVQAALLVQQDVAGIDLNCGCPKDFSTKGGMGAALLSTPDLLCSILEALVEAVDVPVSCKIRLLPTQEDTLALVEKISRTGIACLTVHCRTKDMRDREHALHDRLRDIVELVEARGIPVIANGDCFGAHDVEKIKSITGVSSIMIARGAEANPSCFRSSGLAEPVSEIIPLYLKIALAVDNHFSNTKYCLQCGSLADKHMTPGGSKPTTSKQLSALKQSMSSAKTYADFCKLFDVDEAAARLETVEDILPDLLELEGRRAQSDDRKGLQQIEAILDESATAASSAEVAAA
ncbi:uncharacterized protein L969DRAFT_50568 [Mixia osmundae IAM 14324]|uniref:DUS-like FMN-binding domain-containing protein n=1 Tax=Mixia osmundae (strain CBS 9802 / IAM 14324 / JCM 22182 / KY 12970) TaxID=764103 RepID=G7E129_MIXOS|nr:uncharacterized protein L969DRAFT_50568 [Mixia osmundae IAM 14324]KEI38825.1 hypothetical protein L969DRAFT_50568 [Mixia osmundae IAM 14324]GAA96539.1 hypothetical protein E5Q_03207 [Mixia osmundae IAM 14324]